MSDLEYYLLFDALAIACVLAVYWIGKALVAWVEKRAIKSALT
jgi:hypothetical protein